LQTIFITALTVLVGGVLLEFVVDGIYNDFFADLFVGVLRAFRVKEARAIELYWIFIGNNKIVFGVLGFLILFAIFFYASLSKVTKYLEQIGNGIDNILGESSEPVHMVAELQPIETQLNEIKSTLKRQERESLETEQKKNDLVVFLAHDLKTPLTSIVAYLTMLESNPDMLVEERAKYTQISLEKALRLGELIGEFFEITRFNLQDITLEMSEWNLARMLEQLADECYGVLREKGLRCTLHTEEHLEICADADKLVRVFENLLRNAISYCYSNTEIKIDARKEGKNIKIVFTNEGDSIEPHQLRMIFEKFYRADESRASKTGGAGLGLAISKDIVELHQGSIYAESEDAQTRFVVILPGKETQDEIHTRGRRASRGNARGRKGI
jgi:Signal transduction histidine kinase